MSTRSEEEIKRSIAGRLARKLEESPKSMAWILARYRDVEGISETELAYRLGISIDDLHLLCMYGRPRNYLFAEDIETISERFGIDQLVVASLVRHVEAIDTITSYGEISVESGMLAAARDHAAEEREDYDSEHEASGEPPDSEQDDEQ